MSLSGPEIRHRLKEQEATVAVLLRELAQLRAQAPPLPPLSTAQPQPQPQPTTTTTTTRIRVPPSSIAASASTSPPLPHTALSTTTATTTSTSTAQAQPIPSSIAPTLSFPPIPASPKLVIQQQKRAVKAESASAMVLDNVNEETPSAIPVPTPTAPTATATSVPPIPSGTVSSASSSADQDSVMGEMDMGSDAGLNSENGDKLISSEEKRRFKKTCMMIWSKLAEHRYGNVFTRAEKSPFYLSVIKNPINLTVIKNRIRDGEISTMEEFHRDILLMLANAVMFNDEGSEIAEMAKTLRVFVETELATLENVRRMKEFMSE